MLHYISIVMYVLRILTASSFHYTAHHQNPLRLSRHPAQLTLKIILIKNQSYHLTLKVV